MISRPLRPRWLARGDLRRVAAALLAGALIAGLGGCAATPSEPAAEVLDRQTGVTLVHMPRTMELLATVPRGLGADPFAYAAPFATNRMGSTSYYVWVAVPVDVGGTEPPQLYTDDAPLTLQAIPSGLAPLGLSAAPYERPAPWSAEYYFRIDLPALKALASARSVAIVTRNDKTGETRFVGPTVRELAVFLERLGTN